MTRTAHPLLKVPFRRIGEPLQASDRQFIICCWLKENMEIAALTDLAIQKECDSTEKFREALPHSMLNDFFEKCPDDFRMFLEMPYVGQVEFINEYVPKFWRDFNVVCYDIETGEELDLFFEKELN